MAKLNTIRLTPGRHPFTVQLELNGQVIEVWTRLTLLTLRAGLDEDGDLAMTEISIDLPVDELDVSVEALITLRALIETKGLESGTALGRIAPNPALAVNREVFEHLLLQYELRYEQLSEETHEDFLSRGIDDEMAIDEKRTRSAAAATAVLRHYLRTGKLVHYTDAIAAGAVEPERRQG